MYIISKYKDYYDNAVGMGIDKTIVYKRHVKEIHPPRDIVTKIDDLSFGWDSRFTINNLYTIPEGSYNSEIIVIGFCGKLYFGVKFTKEIKTRYGSKQKSEIIFDPIKIKKRISLSDRKKYSWEKTYVPHSQRFDNYLLRLNAVDPTEWFRSYNTPIFAYGTPAVETRWRKSSNKNFIINPILKDYGFMKVIDPYTAFQEIQMYISGVLGINKDGTEFPATEKEKVAQHGMDKWSFRKEPSK